MEIKQAEFLIAASHLTFAKGLDVKKNYFLQTSLSSGWTLNFDSNLRMYWARQRIRFWNFEFWNVTIYQILECLNKLRTRTIRLGNWVRIRIFRNIGIKMWFHTFTDIICIYSKIIFSMWLQVLRQWLDCWFPIWQL